MSVGLFFSDEFGVDEEVIDNYGAINISVFEDIPLFIDPFLLFASSKREYQELHKEIIKYIVFLKKQAKKYSKTKGVLNNWFKFPEVEQTCLGYTKAGHSGSGLGDDFANKLFDSLQTYFKNFGEEDISSDSHIEKLCLISQGVGKDKISDFTTNLIKKYLLEFTEKFAKKYLNKQQCKNILVDKVEFDFSLEIWKPKEYLLPVYLKDGIEDYVILTPKALLRKEEIFINKSEMLEQMDLIINTIENETLRFQMNNYMSSTLINDEMTSREAIEIAKKLVEKYPEFVDYYIKFKEANTEDAEHANGFEVAFMEYLTNKSVKDIIRLLQDETAFYETGKSTYEDSMKRVKFLKHVIENNNGYRLFYYKNQPIAKEEDLQLLFKFVWFATFYDVNSEVDNGSGPVDYKISFGSRDSTLVEFKLAKNTKLKNSLKPDKQVDIYKKANRTDNAIIAILYFSAEEKERVVTILKEINRDEDKSIILIDARADNKPSASKA